MAAAAKLTKAAASAAPKPPRLSLYRIEQYPLRVVPGRTDRSWMDQTNERFAYRCLPLTIANATGWEILSPCSFEAIWDGGDDKSAIKLNKLDAYPHLERHVTSHFGHGTLTFHTGYLFRTDPGWGTLVRGAPNFATDGILALEGLVETDWLPFSFTMNWLFTRPGKVVFNEGDPIAFVTPVPHLMIDPIEPEIIDIQDDPALFAEYSEWAHRRNAFNAGLEKRDPETLKQGWQRYYTQGKTTDGTKVTETHLSKRKLKTPKIVPPGQGGGRGDGTV
jgi:hypothetical protein